MVLQAHMVHDEHDEKFNALDKQVRNSSKCLSRDKQ